jgi:capsular polysaccharide biosynthesis protein
VLRDRKLILSVVDENVRLPEVQGLSSLNAHSRSARTTVLPGSNKHANEWYAECIEGAAGPAPPPEWDQYQDICCAPVTIYRQLEAHYSPGTGAIVTNDGAVLSNSVEEVRYITQDFTGLPGASSDRDRIVLALPKREKHLEKVIVTMPWGGIYNYGHFVLDCLPAAALLSTMKEFGKHRFVFPPLKPWHIRHLELLGIEPLECRDDWYFADEVVYTNCMNLFLHWPNLSYRTLVSAQTRQLASATTAELPRRLYIARRDNEKRLFVSEETFQARLTEAGFEIICPEDMSIDQQIASFRSADLIVGCSGAGLANTIYCKSGTVVIEIQPSLARGIWVRNICALMGLRWRPYFCEAKPAAVPYVIGGVERSDVGITFDVGLDDFLSFLKGAQPRR